MAKLLQMWLHWGFWDGGLSWIIQMGPKCNHKGPWKREAERSLTQWTEEKAVRPLRQRLAWRQGMLSSGLEPSKIQKVLEESKCFSPVQMPFLKAASVTRFLCIFPERTGAWTSKIGIYIFFLPFYVLVNLCLVCFLSPCFFTNNDSWREFH